MNFERFEFKEMEVEPFQVKEVLRCLVHSILFNRALGSVVPKDAECSAVDNVPYAKLDDPNVDDSVERGIDRFTTAWNKSGSLKGNVCVGFYEKSTKKTFLFGTKEEKMFWERWIIPLAFVDQKSAGGASSSAGKPANTQGERDRLARERQQRLVENLVYLVSCVNEKKDHIPPVKSSSTVALAFSFELSHTTGEKTDESWGLSTIKRMLKQGPPMLLS